MGVPGSTVPRYTVDRYLALVADGVLGSGDHVELLDGLIVTDPPARPPHATAVGRVADALRRAIGERALINVQQPFDAGPYSCPEPDVAVVPGERSDYDERHPAHALLLVEVSDSSLPQDRLTKAAIYAAAEVPEYWIVNLPDVCVEIHREPLASEGRFVFRGLARHGEAIELSTMPGVRIAVGDLFPRRRS